VEFSLLTALALVVVLGISAQWLAWRLRLPSILLLMLMGFAAGPEGIGVVDPDAMFGDLLLPVVSLSVAILLFEGGLTLRRGDIAGHQKVVFRLVTLGALITWVLAAGAAWLLGGISWKAAILLGAILTVTGPTVIAPLLRQIRPTGAVGPILRWEGILIDPVGAVLAVLVLEGLVALLSEGAGFSPVADIGKTIVLGGGAGLIAGWALMQLLARYWIPDHLHNAAALGMAMLAFVVGNAAQHEAGLLSVTLMGVFLANQKRVQIDHIVEFKENVQVLLIAMLFILMAARLEFSELVDVGFGGVLFLIALIVVVRPIAIYACTAGSTLKPREKLFLAAMAPRGIVAAAIASVFALRLEAMGVAGARSIVPLVFFVILGTVALYGLAGAPLAYRLGLATRKPQGILLLGAHEWARALGETLRDAGLDVLLVDTNARNIRTARMAGLRTFRGSLLSDVTDEFIDLSGLGRLFALTPNNEVNTLSAQHYRHLFGRAEVYQLPGGSGHPRGRLLFDADFKTITQAFRDGARFKATLITEQFDIEAWRGQHGTNAIPLLSVEESGTVEVATTDQEFEAKPGCTLIGLTA
jgi:NhaP-type Na+/H+ or K+/H+ antiporter